MCYNINMNEESVKNMSFIYCIDCKYFRHTYTKFGEEKCKHNSNIITVRNYYYARKTYKSYPRYINKDNNCDNYEKKSWWKLW